MKKEGYNLSPKGLDKIILAVRTPLGYAVFAAMIGVLLISLSTAFSSESVQKLLAYTGLSIIVLSVAYVFIISISHPEALKGERNESDPGRLNPCFTDKSKKENNDHVIDRKLTTKLGINKIGFFEEFVELFPSKIESSNIIISMFIHSRRWRENNNSIINRFLLKERSRIIVFLPDMTNVSLITEMKRHFDDGDHLNAFIGDAYRYYFQLKTRFPEKIEVRCFSLYPTYSFYMFDDTAVIAMYPTTTKRRSVPAFEVSSNGEFWNFLGDDLDMLMASCPPLSIEEIQRYIELGKN